MRSDKDIIISKSVMPILPDAYDETHLGATDGAIRQFRGESGVHVRECRDHYAVHQDRFDPRKSPLLHLAFDSPETILALGSAAMIAKAVSKNSMGMRSRATNFSMNPLIFFLTFFSLEGAFRSLKRLIFG